jgi:copper chaperone CopZ
MSKTVTFETPAMYGDHHVQAVRQMLLEIQGVEDVYASSGFHVVDVTYNSDLVGEKDIKKVLQENGYLDEFLIPIEADHATYLESDRSQSYFRHTEVYEKTRQVVGFSQNIGFSGRPLWHCPGFGVIKDKMED